MRVFAQEARGILSRTSGFIARAGFTHSLTPARNCLYGCSYCYVPTMRIRGGLKPLDWQRWGQHTTYKSNAAGLLRKQVRSDQVIYCSPMVDPYQPAERDVRAMPAILEALFHNPPAVFVLQTRGTLVLRDLDLLRELASRTRLRVSFSVTTDSEDVRALYEPRCEAIGDRLQAISRLAASGIHAHCTLAPILPCDPLRLAELALACSEEAIIADPLHARESKRHGATTRPEARRVSEANAYSQWHIPAFQARPVGVIRARVERAGREFGLGADGFAILARQGGKS